MKRTSNEVSVAVGKSLKAFRIARDLSQEQLAGEAELDRTYISLVERGLTNPTILTLSTICFCLKISLSELLEPVKENLKPSWADPDAVRRRQNQASPDRIEKRTRLR
ncbi:MAG: helix-turn-helix transcriptional regulator [Undibacterium sp.]|nr:helix-turn-helix transcriptional regulator [Undibacterium sp.]